MTPLLVGPVQAQVISPSRGVVCDQRGQVCYDSQGLSMALTQEYFGNLAVQNAMTQIGSGPAPQDFRLSTGVACSSQARTCWSDGWSRNVIDWQLTSQLYNRSVNEGAGGGAASPERAGGVCNLNRSGQQLFSGSCQLKKISKANKTRFEAVLGNGQTFSFVSRDGTFVIQDSTGGSWPVQFENRGTTGVFRWNDMQLTATRTTPVNGTGSAGDALGAAAGAAIGAGLGSLLNSLFH
ncbi:MAG: YcgJ family protein [Vulcanococcus sp.]